MAKNPGEPSVQYIKGVGPRRAALLGRLGIKTVLDLLYYLPHRYEDRRNISPIGDLTLSSETPQTAIGKVTASRLKKLPRGLSILEVTVSDGTGILTAKWFNQPYLGSRFKAGDEVVLTGAVKAPYRGRWPEMENPEFEFAAGETEGLIHTGRIVPFYRATENLSSRHLRAIVFNALRGHLKEVADPVPEEMLSRLGLPGLRTAISGCHFPGDGADVRTLNAWQDACQKRLCFDELFMLQLGLAALKSERGSSSGIPFAAAGRLLLRLRKALPFSLTQAQEKALGEILSDMKSPCRMQRLLQGDVGSGKTVVALMAMLFAVESGYQAALMAPTELLAEQHFKNISALIRGLGVKVSLITGSKREKPVEEIAKGRMDMVIGTHALLEEGVRFGRLGLAVIDEQHRFGVKQRAVLKGKALNPDVLIMTATPIPRTLAMTLYGDLDYSAIEGLPPGRTPVLTELFGPGDKSSLYKAIREEIRQGGQVYVVYPVIEESEKLALKSAILGEEALRKIFPKTRVALIHGRMRPEEREAVMTAFKQGKIDILVSTTVVEVGVDVANASLMIVVHAERFGLSQLHQLRGRVGRGKRRSRCFLVAYGPLSKEAQKRLRAMLETSDGFKLAECDLALRGPGEFMGTKQSGMPELKVADIIRDKSLLTPARDEAFGLLEESPGLRRRPLLRAALERFWHGKVELFKTA